MNPSRKQCPIGHFVVEDTYQYCRECGQALEPYQGQLCSCGKFDYRGYTREILFCPLCGKRRTINTKVEEGHHE